MRLAGAADRDAIFTLVNEAFILERPLKKGGSDRLSDFEGELDLLMARGVFLICEQGAETLVASVYLEPGYSGRTGRCYLGMLAIAPGRQRSGLGRRMMQEAEQYAREQGCFAMDLRVVSPREAQLLPFYQRLGYHLDGTEPYPDALAVKMAVPGHFLCMTKKL